jgi:rhodanese-related sulfurtransferase
MVQEITPEQLYSTLKATQAPSSVFLLDVREPEEFSFTHIRGSRHIPMMELEERIDEVSGDLKKADMTVVVCRSGCRSEAVTEYLLQTGFLNAHNLSGGINAYSAYDESVIAY